MANSFALDSQSYQGRHLRLTCNQIPSIASNLSTVEWTLAATGGSSSYYTTGPTTVKINGKIVYYKAKTAWTSHEFPAAKGSVSGVATVPHDELGNAVIEVSIRTNIYTGVLQTKTGTWELDPITRFADLTTAAGFTDDENPTISYSNYAGDLVDGLEAAISVDGETPLVEYRPIPTDTAEYTFQLTDVDRNALRNATPNSNSLQVHFLLKTTIGDAVGVDSVASTMQIVKADPVVVPEIIDSNEETVSVTGDSSVLVVLHSLAKVTLNATAQKGATITSTKVKQGETTLSGDGEFLVSTADPIIITVTDSRENVTTLQAENTIVPYINPTCIIEHALPDAGGEMTLSVIGQAYSGTIGKQSNQLVVQYRHRAGSGDYGSWITIASVTQNGNEYTATTVVTGLDYKTRHTFQARAVDLLHTDGVLSSAQTFIAEPTFDWGENDFRFNVPVSMAGHKITDIALPENEGDAIPFGYTDPRYLGIAGGTLTGPIEMGGNSLSGLAEPINGSDAATKKTIDEAIARVLTMDLLWENASPTSSFAQQTVQMDLSEYQMVLCQCRLNQTAATLVPSNFIRVGAASGADAYGIVTGYPVRRTITATAEGVKFGEGCKYTSFGSSNVNANNTVLIPVEIYGLKGVGV